MEENIVITNNNGYQGQWSMLINSTDLEETDNLFNLIKNKYSIFQNTSVDKNCYLSRVGIQANPGDKIIINFVNGTNNDLTEIEIGKTGIYEIDNVRINLLKFSQETEIKPNVIIDYIIQEV